MKNKGILCLMFTFFYGVLSAQHDDCASATQLTPSLTTCSFASGSSAGATQSRPGCSGNSDDDVWFYFVANSTVMTVEVDPDAGYDAVFQLYATNCAGASLGCQDSKAIGLNEKRTYSGLTIGNSYYLRVYHFGIGSGSSAFRVCTYGVAAPTNVDPCSAYALPAVDPSCNFQTYELINTSPSLVPTPSSCTGGGSLSANYAGGDMWFKVEVPSSGELEISTIGIDFSDGGMAIYSGATCGGALTQLTCNGDRDNPNGKFMPYIYETGLTPGDTIYIRIWEENNNANGLFKLCVSTPDNATCPSALNICDINGYGGTTSPNYIVDRPGNMAGKDEVPPGPFGTGYTGSSPVQIDNNSWIVFQAASTTASFTVEIEDCLDGNGVQMQIFSGAACDNFVAVSNFLETANSQVLTANGLIPGNSYYIMIDGFAGDVCSYTVTANSGVQTVSASATDTSFCVGQSATVNANVFGSGSYTYTWYSVPAGGPYPSSPSFSVSPTTDTEYFVDITGACGAITTASVKLFVKPIPTAPSVVVSSSTICPNGSSLITASGTTGATYAVYNTASGGTPIGYTPYTYSPNGFSGSRTFYIETVTVDTCTSPTRTSEIITSQDNTAPTISCPSPQVVYANGSCNFALPDYRTSTTVSDNCTSTVTNVTQSPIPGTILAGHNTNQTVTITATDSSGNSSNCSFNVNLQDSTRPIIMGGCPVSSAVNVDGNCQYTLPDYTGTVTTNDNCASSVSITYVQQPASGTVLSGLGFVQDVLIIAIDGANNRDTCSFTITLEDATPAVVSCPADFRDTSDLEQCEYLVPDFSGLITLTSDNCANSGTGANITQTPAIGTAIDITENDEDYLVTLIYTDASNNQSQCSFTVTATCSRELVIPQFISPNGDGFNDIFVIENIGVYPGNKIQIYSRWGNLVYTKENYDNTWDGKANMGAVNLGSSSLPSGTYYYTLTRPNQDDVSGFIRLERD